MDFFFMDSSLFLQADDFRGESTVLDSFLQKIIARHENYELRLSDLRLPFPDLLGVKSTVLVVEVLESQF